MHQHILTRKVPGLGQDAFDPRRLIRPHHLRASDGSITCTDSVGIESWSARL